MVIFQSLFSVIFLSLSTRLNGFRHFAFTYSYAVMPLRRISFVANENDVLVIARVKCMSFLMLEVQ